MWYKLQIKMTFLNISKDIIHYKYSKCTSQYLAVFSKMFLKVLMGFFDILGFI